MFTHGMKMWRARFPPEIEPMTSSYGDPFTKESYKRILNTTQASFVSRELSEIAYGEGANECT